MTEDGERFGVYRIERKLALGGMAEILLARVNDVEGLHRPVVLKRILPALSNDPHFIRHFLNEARLAAQLNHPCIAQVFDLGRVGERYFMAMEYIRGFDVSVLLAHAREKRRPMPAAVALRIAVDLCEALAYAHDARDAEGRPLGIVHRDISPSNIIVAEHGFAKVVDFGIAKATASNEQATQTGSLRGKYAYFAPEQLVGRKLDHRVDVFAAGIVLCELLTSENPFRAEGEFATLQNIAQCELAPMGDRVPEGIEAIIVRALAKSPAARYASARDLLRDIEAAARRAGIALSHTAVADYLDAERVALSLTVERIGAGGSTGSEPTETSEIDGPTRVVGVRALGSATETRKAIARQRLIQRAARTAAVAMAGVVLGAVAMWWSKPGAGAAPRTVIVPLAQATRITGSDANTVTAAVAEPGSRTGSFNASAAPSAPPASSANAGASAKAETYPTAAAPGAGGSRIASGALLTSASPLAAPGFVARAREGSTNGHGATAAAAPGTAVASSAEGGTSLPTDAPAAPGKTAGSRATASDAPAPGTAVGPSMGGVAAKARATGTAAAPGSVAGASTAAGGGAAKAGASAAPAAPGSAAGASTAGGAAAKGGATAAVLGATGASGGAGAKSGAKVIVAARARKLSSPPGKLRIVVRPWATVLIDGVLAGVTPFAPMTLAAGTHEIVLENSELNKRFVQKVTVPSAETLVIDYDFSESD